MELRLQFFWYHGVTAHTVVRTGSRVRTEASSAQAGLQGQMDWHRGESVEINSIVIVSLASPKEKIWGQLISLDAAGVTLRGMDLGSFDDFIRQILAQEESTVGLALVFYPMHRVERIARDEASGAIPSLADRFREKIGVTIQEYLGIEAPQI
jgi:hypothetical protein